MWFAVRHSACRPFCGTQERHVSKCLDQFIDQHVLKTMNSSISSFREPLSCSHEKQKKQTVALKTHPHPSSQHPRWNIFDFAIITLQLGGCWGRPTTGRFFVSSRLRRRPSEGSWTAQTRRQPPNSHQSLPSQLEVLDPRPPVVPSFRRWDWGPGCHVRVQSYRT